MLTTMGSAFTPVRNDMLGNCAKITLAAQKHNSGTLQDLVAKDGKSGSGTDALLWSVIVDSGTHYGDSGTYYGDSGIYYGDSGIHYVDSGIH